MDYRGIITAGYHVDAGGQTAIRIVSQGYVGELATIEFVASPRKIILSTDGRVIGIRDNRVIYATLGSRTIKGSA